MTTIARMLAIALAALMLAAPAQAAERVALLLGNGDYRHTTRLGSPTQDIEAMASALEAIGFEVEKLADADERSMGRAIRAFSRKAEKADTALLYYSGHGMEIAGKNYLVPVDAQLEREADAGFEAIPLDAVVAAASGAKRLSVVVLDACRNNRFPGPNKSGAKGFTPIRARPGQLIAFATAPGTVAYDGGGALSPFTQALTEALTDPTAVGLDVRQLFGSLGPRTSTLAKGPQEPFTHAAGFGRASVTLTGLAAAPGGKPAQAGDGREAAAKGAYEAAKKLGAPDALALVAKRYPGTFWGDLAAREAAARPRSSAGLETAPQFRELAAMAAPAVVGVATSSKSRGSGVPEFDKFFSGKAEESWSLRPLGSGFIIDEAGYVVTSHHVVADADNVQIMLADGRSFNAAMIGTDKRSDIALLKIEAPEPLPFLSWADSDSLRLGDPVAAMGDPFGQGATLAAGVVASVQKRDLLYEHIRVDANIGRGMSGGPLLNQKGEVVGVSTTVITTDGASPSTDWAIPSSLARSVAEQLASLGETRRGAIGVQVQNVTQEIAERLGLPEVKGVLITGTMAGGPAEKVELRKDDVVLRFGEKAVATVQDLVRAVAESAPGSSHKLEFFREGRNMELTIEVGEGG